MDGDTRKLDSSSTELDRMRFELDKERHSDEVALKRRELALKKYELKRNNTLFGKTGPIVLGLAGTFAGLVVNIFVTFIQGKNTAEVEARKSEMSLIAEISKTGDPKVAQQNLLWFAQAGLIRDPEGKIRELIMNNTASPVLPKAEKTTEPNAPQSKPASKDFFLGDVISRPIEIYGVTLTVSDVGTAGAQLSSKINLIRPVCLPMGVNGRERAVLLATATYQSGGTKTFLLRAFSQSANNSENQASGGVAIGQDVPTGFTVRVEGRCG